MSTTTNLHAVYSIDQASRLSGLSRERLMQWDRAGFFSPEYADKNRRLPLSRMYSFEDIVGLKTLAQLRDRHHVTMKELRRVADVLAKETFRPWSDLRLTALNRSVVCVDEDGKGAGVIDGQTTCIELGSVMEEVAEEARRMRARQPGTVGQIEKTKFIVHNAARIAGTRVPVSAVKAYIKQGARDGEILEAYPDLTPADILSVRELIELDAA